MTLHIEIGGTDYGLNGEAVVRSIATTKGSDSRNGDATITMRFPLASAYDIRDRMEVRVYDLVGGTANGVFGGFVVAVESSGPRGTEYRDVSVKCVDYNVLWDAIVCRLASPITLSAATLPSQLTALVQGFQYGGFATVSKLIDTTSYVTNLTGATTLPALVIPGGSTMRQGMRSLMANVQANTSALRPRWSISLESDGAGGVQAAVVLVDGASTPTPVADFAKNPTGSQRTIRDIKRTLDSSMPLVNSRQARWHTSFGEQYVSYANSTSAGSYPNDYRNDGLSGGKGYWWDLPLDDKDSTNATDALNKLTQLVEAVEFPRESTILTYDKAASETLFIRVGEAVLVTWPQDQLVSASYIVTGVSITFPNMADQGYQRVSLTLGLPKLELGQDGTDGLAGPPHEITWAPIPPSGLMVNPAYGTNGYTWQGQGFATAGFIWTAPAGRQPALYRLHLHETTPGAHDLFVEIPGDTLTGTVGLLEVGSTYTPSIVAVWPGAESTPFTGTNIVVPQQAPGPPTALAVDTTWTWGILGYLYNGHGGASVRLSFTPPAQAPDHYVLQVIVGSDGISEKRFPGADVGVVAEGLVVGNTYTYKVYSETEHGIRSTPATLSNIIVPNPPTDSLQNGGFEYVGAGVSNTIRNWTIIKAVSGFVALDTAMHSGATAVKMVTSGTVGSMAQVQSDLVIARGQTYSLKLWAKKSSITGTLKWTYTWYDTDGTTVLGTSTGTMILTTSYVLYPATATAPAGAAYYRITFEPSSTGQTLFVDDVTSDPQAIAADIGTGVVGFTQLGSAVSDAIPGGSTGVGLKLETLDTSLSKTQTATIFVPNNSLKADSGPPLSVVELDFDAPTIPAQISSITWSNSTAENQVFTGTMDTSYAKAGRPIHLIATGRISNGLAGHTTTVRIKANGTTVFTVSVPTITATNAPWMIDFLMTIRSDGASGTAWAYLMPRFNNVAQVDQTRTATFALDTTSAVTLTVTSQFSALSASDTISCDMGIMR